MSFLTLARSCFSSSSTGRSVCSGGKKRPFGANRVRTVLGAGVSFPTQVFACVLLFSSGFGSFESLNLSHVLVTRNENRACGVLAGSRYDPAFLLPPSLSLSLLILLNESFSTVYCRPQTDKSAQRTRPCKMARKGRFLLPRALRALAPVLG